MALETTMRDSAPLPDTDVRPDASTPLPHDEATARLTLQVNGRPVTHTVTVRKNLADFLRQDLGLTGTHIGCEQGVCGACSVLVDGQLVRACLMLAVQAHNTCVTTVEALHEDALGQALQEAFYERAALQCGFCTPGMLATAHELLRTCANPSRDEIRAYLAANYCRCTGYEAIVDAIETVSKQDVCVNYGFPTPTASPPWNCANSATSPSWPKN